MAVGAATAKAMMATAEATTATVVAVVVHVQRHRADNDDVTARYPGSTPQTLEFDTALRRRRDRCCSAGC